MRVYKRCRCADCHQCKHHYHYVFKLFGRRFPGCTKTANKKLAEQIASTRRVDTLKEHEGLQKPKPILFSEHAKAYVAHTAKANRSSYKDQAVLTRFVKSAGDRFVSDYSAFHVERWKRERAE